MNACITNDKCLNDQQLFINSPCVRHKMRGTKINWWVCGVRRVVCRPVARIDFFLVGVRMGPPKVDLLDPKSGHFEPGPLPLLLKPHFWSTLWIKVDLLADLGRCVAPLHPLATGLVVWMEGPNFWSPNHKDRIPHNIPVSWYIRNLMLVLIQNTLWCRLFSEGKRRR